MWTWLWLGQLLIFALGVTRGEYLGCFRDLHHSLMSGSRQNLVLTLNSQRCISLCLSKGFNYAGLRSRVTCLCDQKTPLEYQRVAESLCDAKCVGDETQKCGGDYTVSVYSTLHNEIIGNRVHLPLLLEDSLTGCYKDDNNNRLLQGYFKEFEHNLPDKCKHICYEKGFLYSGVEYSNQCFCGDNHPSPRHLRDFSLCDMKCSSEPSIKCGGSGHIAIYETNITDVPEFGKKLGCFHDNGPRILEDFKTDLKDTNTPRRCMNICRSLGYQFSGVEYGYECFCGNSLNVNISKDSPDESCNTTCPGDKTQQCGSNWKLAAYRTSLEEYPVFQKVGCVFAAEYQMLTGFRKDFPQITTPEKCSNLCYNKGFVFATLISRTQCWCGNTEPAEALYKKSTIVEDCEEKHEPVYKTGYIAKEHGASTSFVGCFKLEKKVNNEVRLEFGSHFPPFKCTQQCFLRGHLYAGIKNKNECFCFDKHSNTILHKVVNSECSFTCSDDKSKTCGGDEEISLYSTGITDFPVSGKLIGCFLDNTYPRALLEHKTDLVNTNSPRRCANYCLQLGFKFAGVEYQMECFCGNSRPKASLNVPDDQCDSKCSGDVSQKCGGGWRMAVYRTGYSTGTSSAVVPDKSATCEISETTVKGKTVCRGAVIFKDSFTESSILRNWQHTVKNADAPDFEFVTFTSAVSNVHIKEGTLIIKPTLISDNEVKNGSINLNGCTGVAGTRECELSAFSYNILPPVHSARIHTRDSFSFRYGRVEIRARLPLGDWLIPELWLLPKDQSYGSNYLSGKIQIATSRGNRHLTYNGEDIGFAKLESGVMVGPENDVRTQSVTNRLVDGWPLHTHNYTLVWTPDNLLFSVDGQSQQALLPPGAKLSEVLGFKERGVNPWHWNSESRISPFDSEFYLSLGLSVGNARAFPDGCINKNKVKPWTNFKVKAMLNFWLDKETWKPTWEENKSSLIIEQVEITAL